MNINFRTWSYRQTVSRRWLFVEILNIILTSDNIVDVNRMLIGRNVNPSSALLSGHFRWSYANDHFTLWQRLEYNPPICFGQRIFSIHFGMLASPRQKRE